MGDLRDILAADEEEAAAAVKTPPPKPRPPRHEEEAAAVMVKAPPTGKPRLSEPMRPTLSACSEQIASLVRAYRQSRGGDMPADHVPAAYQKAFGCLLNPALYPAELLCTRLYTRLCTRFCTSGRHNMGIEGLQLLAQPCSVPG